MTLEVRNSWTAVCDLIVLVPHHISQVITPEVRNSWTAVYDLIVLVPHHISLGNDTRS